VGAVRGRVCVGCEGRTEQDKGIVEFGVLFFLAVYHNGGITEIVEGQGL
jgi:hypothetical protein